ncbi:MAG: hypothetical protein WCH98_12385, partial [Verrucomicrobiota bacterium]
NFEVAGMCFQSDGHVITILAISVKGYIYICMATFETQKQRKHLKLPNLRFFLKRKCGKTDDVSKGGVLVADFTRSGERLHVALVVENGPAAPRSSLEQDVPKGRIRR